MGSGVTAVAAGGSAGHALRNDGTVWSWGANSDGELGHGSTADSSTPVQVQELSGVNAIAAGNMSGYTLQSDGTAWAWGSDAEGELGKEKLT